MNGAWLLLVAAILAGFQAFVFGRFNFRALSYRRSFSKQAVYEGETVEMIEQWLNKKPLPVPWLRVESRISPNLRFNAAAGGEREISAEQYHKSVFFLPPFCRLTRRHTVLCLKRGYYAFESVDVTAGDLFALSARNRQFPVRCALSVYPALLDFAKIEPLYSRWQGEAQVRRWIMPDPFLVAGIRDYRPGDGMRDIHWRASARMDKLQVKVRDFTAEAKLLVLLNVQLSAAQWDNLMEYEQAAVERDIRVAATLCMRALRDGLEAGFGANACLMGEKGMRRGVMVYPNNGADQGELLLETMARMLVYRELSFPTFLDSLGALTGVDIVMITRYMDEAIEEKCARLRAMGNTVSVLPVDDEGSASA